MTTDTKNTGGPAPDADLHRITEFLIGAAPNEDGKWFHEVADQEAGRFWWRSCVVKMRDVAARAHARDAETIRELVAALMDVEKETNSRRQGEIATTALIAFAAQESKDD